MCLECPQKTSAKGLFGSAKQSKTCVTAMKVMDEIYGKTLWSYGWVFDWEEMMDRDVSRNVSPIGTFLLMCESLACLAFNPDPEG